uniref:Matrin-type domain-containing protein n=1 Tax=Oryzias latipes TaxID=8090 RepID=A0A3P9JHY1_ORYLA
MSYRQYPLPPGGQGSQGQYGLSRPDSERDSWRAHPPFGTQPTFNPSVASSARHSSSDVTIQPRQSLTDIYKTQQSGALMVERTNEYLDKYVKRARNEGRHQPDERNAYSSSTELDKFWSTSTGVNNPTSTTFQAHQFDVQRGANSRFDPLSGLSEFERSDDRVPTTFERRDDERYIPGSVPDKSGPPEAPHGSKNLPELAANILVRFGLDREDLQYLLTYPEDQITFDNLPEILRQIRSQKEKESTPPSPSVPELHTTTSRFSGMNRTIGSGGVQPSKDKVPSDPNLVIDYGHTGKYSQDGNERLKGFGTDSGREQYHTSNKTKVEGKSSNQAPKKVFTPFTIAKKDSEKVPLKAGTSKGFSLQESSDSESSSKSEAPDSEKRRKSYGHRHADRKHDRGFKDQSKSQRHGHRRDVSDKRKKDKVPRQEKQKSPEQQHKLLSQLDQVLQQLQRSQVPPAQQTFPGLQTSHGLLPPPYPTAKPGSAFPPGLPQPDSRFTNYSQMMTRPPPWHYTTTRMDFDGQPTPAMINDYVSTTPKMFPHICTLCNVINPIMRDWLSHQNTSQHLENCKLFRIHFPYWNGQIPPFQSDAGPASAQATYGLPNPNLAPQPHYQNRWVGGRSHSHISDPRSRSRSSTPPWYQSSRSRSRSRSPRRHRSTKYKDRRRSRSRSLSSRRERPYTSSYRSRSRSRERRSSSRKSDKKHSSQRRSREAQSATKRLTKELMETSEARGLSSAGVEDMVKTLAPVLIAELSKMKPVPSSSSPTRPHGAEDREEEAPSETSVKLRGVFPSVAHKDLLDAIETVGKTKSLVVYRSQCQAKVIFENEDDAEKLMSLKSLLVKEVPVFVDQITYSKTSSRKQKSPDKQPGEASAATADKEEPRKTLEEAQEEPRSSSSESSEDEEAPAEEVQQTQESPENLEEETEDPEEEPESSSSAGPAERFSPTDQYSADPETSLTVGEKLETLLTSKNFRCFMNKQKCFRKTFKKTVFLVSGLPEYASGSYTEEELAAVLHPYGFQHTSDSVYVIPQTRMAIAQMPSVKDSKNLVDQTFSEGISFQGTTLSLKPFNNTFTMSPFGFYKSLMTLMHFVVTDGGERTVYIHNISSSDTIKLREDLRNLLRIKNFLPLMNRLFIEFESVLDADLYGIRLSGQMFAQKYTVYRMKSPSSAEEPSTAPEWRTPPFWMTMKTAPFLYPTATHSFISPACVSVDQPADIVKAAVIGSEFATVMLSGLPENGYTHEDVAKLVWPFFSTPNFQVLNQNLYVLPLQRRAFVFFSNWTACSEFLKEHVRTPVSLKGHTLSVQVVLEKIHPGSNQSTVYKSLMKWSSPLKPDPEFLNNRLLSVEVTDTSAALVMTIMKVVDSISPFVNFLPLANRIYVEMLSVMAVIDVQLKISSMEPSQLPSDWKKVKRIEPMSTLQQRLIKCSQTPLYLKPDPPPKTKKKKKKKSQRKAHMEAGPVTAGDCDDYIANNRVPRASATAARVLIAAKLTEEAQRVTGSGVTANTEISPHLSGMGSQLTDSREDSAQEEKKGAGEEEEGTIQGGQNLPGPLKNEEEKGEQKDEDLEENHQNNSHGFSNTCPEGEDLEPGLTIRQVPEKPAAEDDQQQSPRGDEGNREEICLESSTSKEESLQDSTGDFMEQERSEPAAADPIGAEDNRLTLVTMTNPARDPEEGQSPTETEDEVQQESMDHGGEEDQVEPESLISSSASSIGRRKTTDLETPTGGNFLADDTKKLPNIEATAAPEDARTETPEERVFGDDQPTEAEKPNRSLPAATGGSTQTEEDSREANDEEDEAPDEAENCGSTAEKTLLLEERSEERAAEEAAVEVNQEEESRPEEEKADFTRPEVPSAADEDQKTVVVSTHGDNTEEAVKMKEETEEDQNLKVTPRPRGRPRKTRKAPVEAAVRRSGRGKRSAEDPRIPSVPAAGAEAEAVKESDRTDGPTPGGDEQEQHSRTEAEGGMEPDGPEAKRPRPEPLGPDSRSQLLPFNPERSVGQEFMELKWVHFCRLCSVYCGSADADGERHCRSQQHYCNLQEHYQQLQQEPATTATHQEPTSGKE